MIEEIGANEAERGDGLRRASPMGKQIDATAIQRFLDDVEGAGLELQSLMLWRDGAVVAEGFHWPYGPDRLRMSHSMTKSVTACAIGLLVDAGKLALQDRVASFFPEVAIDPASPAARMTVEDLITMRTGHAREVSGSIWRGIGTSWIAEFFKIPIVHEPGTHYLYSSAASYMLSAIVQRVTGDTIHAYLTPRLFEPLGMRRLRWDVGPDGINPGGNGITFLPVDALKLGILHAQKGVWEGMQILPLWWVEAATRAQGADDYGYHWVIGDTYFTALGQFVQMVVVYPEHDAVLAIHSAMEESAVLLPHLKRHFPAAFAGGDAEADRTLAKRLAGWAAEPALRSSATGDPARLEGDWTVAPNELDIERIGLRFTADSVRLALADASGEHFLAAPLDSWRTAPLTFPGASLHHGYVMAETPTVAGARWTGEHALEITLHFVESAFRDTLTIARNGDALTLDRRVNINSGARAWPTLRGSRVG
ncbi:serine hydrolase [Sphingomonas sp. JC676]|uniref:serine hydrolase domain-containing protein n=1 Tax=Sphingomonas sp. JC676 TaxID=2768065 RepID=UPI0016578F4D|nr:serine hydrolase [Sphingomonas sp. JC676]MBC9033753.1 serine hydrolase [Sphingomonas sp. JC676]